MTIVFKSHVITSNVKEDNSSRKVFEDLSKEITHCEFDPALSNENWFTKCPWRKILRKEIGIEKGRKRDRGRLNERNVEREREM